MKKPTGYLGRSWDDMTKEEVIDAFMYLYEKYEKEQKESRRYMKMWMEDSIKHGKIKI